MSANEILSLVASGKLSVADASAKLDAIAPKGGRLYCKVSEKGCVSLYGVNSRMPVSLYADQWERVADFMPEVLKFIAANAASLPRKAKAA
jgi:hypothetical protein